MQPPDAGHEATAARRKAAWRVLSPLLDEALALDADSRERWLAELGTTLPTVARELRALLDECEQLEARGFLAPAPFADLLGPIPSLAGQQVGAWVLERPIGRGGMGTVWLARRGDGRFEGVAAVKLLNVALLGRSAEARFRREGSLLARLSHPNIARLFDAGVTAGGQPYLVLEHVEGVRIDRWCEERRLEVPARLALFRQVLDAVGHAHASLVVHRDLKPSNILVARDGAVKLLDFGIAKLLEGEGDAERTAVTVEGEGALTPAFAAPEQVRGEEVTTATDVYSLGVLLYLLLSGRHPTAEGARSPADAIRGVLDAEPARLALGDLDTVLAKALRKAPAERYQSVAAFADDLARYLRHEPVSARRDSLPYRARKFIRRHRVAVGAGAVVAAGLLGATVFSVEQMREARRQAREARLQRDAAVYERKRADAQIEFQHLLFSGIGTERVTMREIVDQGRILLEREFAGDPRLAASIAVALGEYYTELAEEERQAEMLRIADSLATLSGAADVRLEVRCNRALNLQKRYRASHAAALIDSIRPLLRTAAPGDAAECLALLAETEVQAGHYDSAAAMGWRAAAIQERLGETKGSVYLSTLNTVANALEKLKRRREALELYRRVAAVMDSTGRERSMGRNVIKNNIGIALSNLGEMIAAERVLHETLEEFGRSSPSGQVHPTIIINYCGAALFLRQLDSAGTWYERLVRQAAARGADALPDEEEGAYGMAEVELLRGRLSEAARWIAEVRRINARLGGPWPENAATLDGALAHAGGDAGAAMAHFRRALRDVGYFDGKRTYKMRKMLIRAAEAALDVPAPGEALEYARAAHGIATSDSLTETRSAYVGEARLLEGRALLSAGDTAGARAALARAVVALEAGAGAEHPRAAEARTLLAALRRS
jgi:serine/threonine-protein kinase